MMKKRYISPVTNTVQMYELESGILYDSFINAKVRVKELQNVNDGIEGEEPEKFYFGM